MAKLLKVFERRIPFDEKQATPGLFPPKFQTLKHDVRNVSEHPLLQSQRPDRPSSLTRPYLP